MYVRGPVSKEDVIKMMKFAEYNSNEVLELLHCYLKLMLKNKTIIQIQMYGIGEINRERSAFQLLVALKLFDHFQRKFPALSITCQEPLLVEVEKEILRANGVKILESVEFSSKHFLKAAKFASKEIKEPAFICFMIHGMHTMYEEFLEAHWDSKLLSQLIIIGNNPECYAYAPPNVSKLSEFAKLCDKKPLKFFDDFLDECCFHDSWVYSVSKENAEILIGKFE